MLTGLCFLARFRFCGGARGGLCLCLGGGFRLGALFGFLIEFGDLGRRGEIEIEVEVIAAAAARGRLFGKQLDVAIGEQFFDGRAQRVVGHTRLRPQFRRRCFAVDGEEQKTEFP